MDHLDALHLFTRIVEQRSFGRAADQLDVPRATATHAIKQLEARLGTRLLERSTRRVSLTVVGRDFDRQLRQILDALDTTLLGIRGVAATRMGEVTIAAVPSAVNYFLSSVIARYHERYPRVRVKIIDESANTVLLAVARGEADFGLNFVGSQEGDVEFKPLVEEQFVAACRRDHPLAKKRQVRWAELAQYDYIAADKVSGNRLLLDQALAGMAEQPHSLYETRHGTTMIGLVEAGLGVAVVPSMAMPAKDHPLLASVPLVDPVVKRMVGLIKRRSTVLTPAAQEFYNLCAEMQTGQRRRRARKAAA